MKAEISATGVLTLFPESGTEAWALTKWHEAHQIPIDDIQRAQKFHLSATAIRIDMSRYPETLHHAQRICSEVEDHLQRATVSKRPEWKGY